MTVEEAVEWLQEKASINKVGMAGDTVVVEKSKLAEVITIIQEQEEYKDRLKSNLRAPSADFGYYG